MPSTTGDLNRVPECILLVEDHIDTAFLLRIILERNGFRTVVTHSMQDAVLAAATDRFDLILSDIMLPDGTGWELIETLKQLLSVKAIAISALSSRDDIRRSLQAGFDRHMTKPVRADILCGTIREVLMEPPPPENAGTSVMVSGVRPLLRH